MKRVILIVLSLGFFLHGFAQRKSKPQLKFYSAGAGYMDGTMQFFEGYNYEILYANSRQGLPVYSDWQWFSQLSTFPVYYQMNGWVQFADTAKRFRLRIGAGYFYRQDSLIYSSALGSTEMVYGRGATEITNNFSLQVGVAKTTRRILKTFWLYGGAEAELAFTPGSEIDFYEYSYDIKQMQVTEENYFPAGGRLRFSPFLSAWVGVEIRPIPWFGLVGEARSGIGGSIVMNQAIFGLSRTALTGGLAIYPQSFPKRAQ